MHTLYICPVCKEPLRHEDKQYICENRHSFDIAKEGYVNLLMAHKKKTKNPGDNADMIASRSRFLNAGYYENASDFVNDRVAEAIAGMDTDTISLLDVGSGEGYYLARLWERLAANANGKNVSIYGIDISKPAIKRAAKRDRRTEYAVANAYELPAADGSLDMVMHIFARGSEEEYRRVLKEGGLLIAVTPGPEHLLEMKNVIYNTPQEHPVREGAPEGFSPVKTDSIIYNISVEEEEHRKDLLSMTPYYWHIDEDAQKRVGEMGRLDTRVNFTVSVYEKTSG